MALIRWEPVPELKTIQNEMNQLFNTFFDQAGQTGRGNGTMRRWLPPMDLVETNDQYEDQQDGYYRLERPFGAFSRSLTLPDGVDPDGIQAHFDRGVLEIRIPKPEQKKPKTVQITLGANHDMNTIESADANANSGDLVAA